MRTIPWMIAAAALPGSTWAMPLWMPRALIAQGVKEVYGDRGRINPGVIDRYYDLSRRPGNRRAMMEIFRMMMRVNKHELRQTPQRLAQLRVTTLLMWQRDVPGIQVRTYAGVGHIPMEEIPERSAADALSFLQGQML